MYVYTYTYTYIYFLNMYIHIHMYLCMYVYTHTRACMYVYICIYIYILSIRCCDCQSSTLLFARLPHGNLGEPSMRHTFRSLRIWCCPVATTLSSELTALCLLSYPFSLLLWVWLTCCGLRRFLFNRLQTGVALRLFSSTCTKPPNPSTCPSFPTTAPSLIPINFPILQR